MAHGALKIEGKASMKVVALAAASAAAIACSAKAGLDRFVTNSTIMSGPPPLEVSAFGSDFGAITADLDSALAGRVTSNLASSGEGVLMTSNMAIIGGHAGQSWGTAHYDFAERTVIRVDWDWSNLELTGGWSIMSGATRVAALDFSNFAFTSTGGSFGASGTGTAFVTVQVGSYHLGTTYNAQVMPATSSVRFTWVPAPGSLALLGAATLISARRRR